MIGQGVVDVGLLFDFSDVANFSLNMAARLPQAGGWLSLLLPVEGHIGLRMETDGLVEGSIFASLEASTFESLFAHVAFVNAALPDEMVQLRLLIQGVAITPTPPRVADMRDQYENLANRLRGLLDSGDSPVADDDPALQRAHALYTQSVGAVKSQAAFAQAVGQILFDAADEVAQLQLFVPNFMD